MGTEERSTYPRTCYSGLFPKRWFGLCNTLTGHQTVWDFTPGHYRCLTHTPCPTQEGYSSTPHYKVGNILSRTPCNVFSTEPGLLCWAFCVYIVWGAGMDCYYILSMRTEWLAIETITVNLGRRLNYYCAHLLYSLQKQGCTLNLTR